jgi:hypothetical protein
MDKATVRQLQELDPYLINVVSVVLIISIISFVPSCLSKLRTVNVKSFFTIPTVLFMGG